MTRHSGKDHDEGVDVTYSSLLPRPPLFFVHVCAVLATKQASEVPLWCCSSQHPPSHPSSTWLQPIHQRSTRGQIVSVVAYHPEKILLFIGVHWCLFRTPPVPAPLPPPPQPPKIANYVSYIVADQIKHVSLSKNRLFPSPTPPLFLLLLLYQCLDAAHLPYQYWGHLCLFLCGMCCCSNCAWVLLKKCRCLCKCSCTCQSVCLQRRGKIALWEGIAPSRGTPQGRADSTEGLDSLQAAECDGWCGKIALWEGIVLSRGTPQGRADSTEGLDSLQAAECDA